MILLLATGLACSFPSARAARPGGISAQALEKTLQAGGVPLTPAPSQAAAPPTLSMPTAQTSPPNQNPATPFPGLQTATPGSPAVVSLPPPLVSTPACPGGQSRGTSPGATPPADQPPFQYPAQAGDTLFSLAARFGVDAEEITSARPVDPQRLIEPGQILVIPNRYLPAAYPSAVMPDSEVVDSPTAVDLDLPAFISAAGGYLSAYSETVDKQTLSGSEIVRRVALETSVNPRILLAFLEFRSGWVSGRPDPGQVDHPLGFYVTGYNGLYKELSLAAKELNIGYYCWRSGTRTTLEFKDGGATPFSPALNAGSVAVQFLFAKIYPAESWAAALYGPQGFLALYTRLFGDPWQRAAAVEPLYPASLAQPPLDLPFAPGERWALTSGPHISWNTGTPPGALDFAPITGERGCGTSRAWALASADGVVVRSENGELTLDLDGDGHEETGWVLLYLHLAASERAAAGTVVRAGDRLGHPSCEGGSATGIHVHVARKYNGEWIPADGPAPFVLSGWTAHAGEKPYQGTLTRGGEVVTAQPDGSHGSTIVR